MKQLFGIFAFVILTSFIVVEPKKLPDGHYKVELDKEYKKRGLNDFDFTLENEKFITQIAHKYETLEIIWVDENSFIVKGLTEPVNPNETEKEILKNTKIYFRITKQDKNIYYFTLGEEFDEHPLYAGKFVKTE
ncbi:MAG TPA: hypothetical protein PKN96_06390 [Flavobacterium sp.]|uniref:hypothetical protein n=1 Tax=Flavobacterium sp. TaxID=239 RepID=UPI002BE3D118|nr:hypothetical protein [Flavobacterium sp.]HNP32902.1 hypothetical protein [Flavobacterium sp.]